MSQDRRQSQSSRKFAWTEPHLSRSWWEAEGAPVWRLTLQPVAIVQPALLRMGICTLSCSTEQTHPKVAPNSQQGQHTMFWPFKFLNAWKQVWKKQFHWADPWKSSAITFWVELSILSAANHSRLLHVLCLFPETKNWQESFLKLQPSLSCRTLADNPSLNSGFPDVRNMVASLGLRVQILSLFYWFYFFLIPSVLRRIPIHFCAPQWSLILYCGAAFLPCPIRSRVVWVAQAAFWHLSTSPPSCFLSTRLWGTSAPSGPWWRVTWWLDMVASSWKLKLLSGEVSYYSPEESRM